MKLPYAREIKKPVVFLLCVLFSCVTFWAGLVSLNNWDDLWSGGNYYDSYSINKPMFNYYDRLQEAMTLRQTKEWSGALTYSEQERYDKFLDQLDASRTNFRYQIHSEDGRLIGDNLSGQTLEDAADRIRMETITLYAGNELSRRDEQRFDESTGRQTVLVYDGGEYIPCDPVSTSVGEYNRYGYRSEGDAWSEYSIEHDRRVQSASLVVEYGVCVPLVAHDDFWTGRLDYNNFQQWLPLAAAAAAISLLLTALLAVALCRGTARREGSRDVVLSWQEHIPLDLYLFLDFWVVFLLIVALDSATYSFNQYSTVTTFVGISVFSMSLAAVSLGALLTIVARLKTHRFWRSMLLVRGCGAVCRKLREGFSQWPMIARTVILFLLYLSGTVLSGITIILIPVFQGFVLWHLCRWVKQWRTIRAGTERMVQGEPSFKIGEGWLYPDLREHAEQLNDLGDGMARAVEEQLKGERFKAELITNVSHDLKTPLTSIISYVDLLKKTGIQDQAALKYIEVLERKSQRLKKLTEDLVEASKASTGNLTVIQEKLGFTQLVTQALGEYEEKLDQSGLMSVVSMPEHELYVEADGRHLWRVIDNLLGNCAKYALPGTRVYVDVKAWDGQVSLAVKNISKNELNILPDQLMERFVRGDESRTTEGSGLGLSIARSLTELQGGAFRIDIDGDLFKAVVTFPAYQEPIPLTDGQI